jgi:hypothetical protein
MNPPWLDELADAIGHIIIYSVPMFLLAWVVTSILAKIRLAKWRADVEKLRQKNYPRWRSDLTPGSISDALFRDLEESESWKRPKPDFNKPIPGLIPFRRRPAELDDKDRRKA